MLHITTKGRYGLLAVLELTNAYSDRILQITELSERCQIPKTYLEQLFNQLRRSNIIQSNRGQYGGYKLARAPSQITVWDVLQVLEGNRSCLNDYEKSDSIRQLFEETETGIQQSLSISLEELLKRQRELIDQQINFYI